MSISLKKAGTEDMSTLIEFEKSVAGTKIYSPALEEKDWKEMLAKEIVYLIENNGEVVGNVSYEKKGDDHVYLSGLAIDPRFQGRGIGREVLGKILEELKDVKRIDLVVHPENSRALELYESFGFKEESQKENYFGDGEPRLVLIKEQK